jgi:hypothetical protein
MLIGPLLFFQWTWTEKFMLCCLLLVASPHAHLPRRLSVCAGGAEKKTASAVYFASGQARDAISSSQERERLALAVGAETTNGGATNGKQQANCSQPELKIRIAPRAQERKERAGGISVACNEAFWGLFDGGAGGPASAGR